MALDAISEARLAEVHPVLADRIRSLIAQVTPPRDIRVTAGIRTIAQENALWQIGRDAEGNKIPGEATVTNAKGTESNHVFGYAADLVVMTPDGECDWNDQPWIDLAPKFSLRSGAEWGDRPHVELAEFPPVPTTEAQAVYMEHGSVSAVWDAFPIVV